MLQARAQSLGEALQAAADLGQDVARYGLFQKGDLAPRQETIRLIHTEQGWRIKPTDQKS